MNDDSEINARLAAFLGWEPLEADGYWIQADKTQMSEACFTESLAEMALVEAALFKRGLHVPYSYRLAELVFSHQPSALNAEQGDWFLLATATPKQRAEAAGSAIEAGH